MSLALFLFYYMLLLYASIQKEAGATRLLKFTNVKCSDLPTSNGLTKVEYCRLKVVKRNIVELSVRVALYQLPINNITMRLQCFQRRDGYRPFLYNAYFNFCKLMVAPEEGFSFQKFVFGIIRNHSNLNHSCPWTEDYMIVDRFALDQSKVNVPVPAGVYRLDFTLYFYKIARAVAQVYFEKLD